MQETSIIVAEDAGQMNVCAVQSNQAVQDVSFTFRDTPGTATSKVSFVAHRFSSMHTCILLCL